MPINDRTEYKATDRHVFLVFVLHFIYLLLELLLLLLFSPYFFTNQSFRLVFTHPCGCYDNDRNATFNLMLVMFYKYILCPWGCV